MQSYQDSKSKARRVFIRQPLMFSTPSIPNKQPQCASCKQHLDTIQTLQAEIERLQATVDTYSRMLILNGVDLKNPYSNNKSLNLSSTLPVPLPDIAHSQIGKSPLPVIIKKRKLNPINNILKD